MERIIASVIFESPFFDSDRQIFMFQINLAFSVISTIDLTIRYYDRPNPIPGV